MQLLKGHFRPEFLNRIDEVIVFNSLSQENIRLIVQIQLDRLTRTAAAQDISLKLDDSLVEHLVEVGYQPDFGARELKRKIRQKWKPCWQKKSSAINSSQEIRSALVTMTVLKPSCLRMKQFQ